MKRKLYGKPKNESASSNISDLGQSKPTNIKLCVNTPKNDPVISSVSDPTQPKAMNKNIFDATKNAKMILFNCSSRENILKEKPNVYKDFCMAYDLCDVWFH